MTVTLALIAYVFLSVSGVMGFALWRVKRSGTRRPVEFKLLRGPGETLRRRIARSEENFVFQLMAAILIPPLFVLLPLGWLLEGKKSQDMAGLAPWFIALGLVFVAAFTWMIRWMYRDLTRYRSDCLGYLGERYVAEYLQPLLRRGYEVFHDVPAAGKKSEFNLDHVAVGPTGVALIETKTRRKGGRGIDGPDHKVISTGNKLIWPKGEDRTDLAQVRSEAKWLEDFILQRTGLQTPVKPILAYPGWWITETGRGDVAVVNAKNIVPAILGRAGPPLLTSAQIELIARQLDERCRDVVE